MYVLDYVRFVCQLLPPTWRRGPREAFIQSLCAPIQAMYEAFRGYRTQADKDMNLRPQVMVLVHVMRMRLHHYHKSVYITDGLTNGEYVVHLPIQITHEDAQAIQGFLRHYRRIGTHFKIQYYV